MELLDEFEDFRLGGAASDGSAGVGEHLGFEVQNGEYGDSREFAQFGGEAAAPEDGTIGEGQGPLGQFGIPVPDLVQEGFALGPVDLLEGSLGGKGFGLGEVLLVEEGGDPFPGGQGEGKTEIGAAEKNGFAQPGRGGSRSLQGLGELGQAIEVASGEGGDPSKKGSRGLWARWGSGHAPSIATPLLLLLLLFACQRGTPIPRADPRDQAAGAGGRRPRLLGVSYGADPLRLPDGRAVARARFQAHVVAERASAWLLLKAFLAAQAEEGKVATQDPVLRERFRKVLGGSPDAVKFLPRANGQWSSWSALDDLVSAALLFRDKEEEADLGGAEAVRRAFHRMQKAYRRLPGRLEYKGDKLFGVWGKGRAPAERCYPDVLALLTPPERDRALLELAARIQPRQAPGAGR